MISVTIQDLNVVGFMVSIAPFNSPEHCRNWMNPGECSPGGSCYARCRIFARTCE